MEDQFTERAARAVSERFDPKETAFNSYRPWVIEQIAAGERRASVPLLDRSYIVAMGLAKLAIRLTCVAALIALTVLIVSVRNDEHRTANAVISDSASITKNANGLISQISGIVSTTQGQIAPLAAPLQDAIHNLDLALVAVNRPCITPNSVTHNSVTPCGTLADVNRTLATIRGVFGQIEVGAHHFNGDLTKVDAAGAQLYQDVHSATAAATPLEQQATSTLGTVNGALNSPQAKQAATAGTSMVVDGQRIVRDGADEADKLTHPPIKKLTFWGTLDGIALWVHSHIIPPIL